jgi:hypothetical protein
MEDGKWIGISALAISGLFAWLQRRDSMRYSVEMADMRREAEINAIRCAAETDALKRQNAVQAAQIADCLNSHAAA